VSFELSAVEARVLGSLLEKDLSTPEYYPLSLNALVNACNQKNNRDPVTAYSADEVFAALDAMRHRGWTAFVHEAGSRVEKYRHRVSEQLNLTRSELAVLTALLLKGPQTAGELRQSAGRLHPFEDLEAVHHTLQRMAEREPEALTLQLARLPGTKEPRWAHLLSGVPELDITVAAQAAGASPPGSLATRVAELESQVDALREELHEMRQLYDQVRRLLS
jgi:uncharacterized protein YceH (UPF0502 family)